ncbi:response regulator [Chryseobacterium oryctis]|uniref:Response regulator n=1 Tax=Chryseobacterium oryctis TaxID=2952618 RepID=A0ABT3HRL4_9FLAO|nr:response regulator [Chryseobacterium oryctis]MCW3162423.1 response regulator [Chryseobacterium oryctis]
MNKEFLNIAIVDDNDKNLTSFKNNLSKIKIGTRIQIFENINDILNCINEEEYVVPEIVFINYDVFEEKILFEIKTNGRFKNLSTAIYSDRMSESEIEDFFIKGGNIFVKIKDDETEFKKALSEVIAINWQYHTSGLNKDNFILKIL